MGNDMTPKTQSYTARLIDGDDTPCLNAEKLVPGSVTETELNAEMAARVAGYEASEQMTDAERVKALEAENKRLREFANKVASHNIFAVPQIELRDEAAAVLAVVKGGG